MDDTVGRVLADVEARAIELHARSLWGRTSERSKQRYRLAAAVELVDELRDDATKEN